MKLDIKYRFYTRRHLPLSDRISKTCPSVSQQSKSHLLNETTIRATIAFLIFVRPSVRPSNLEEEVI